MSDSDDLVIVGSSSESHNSDDVETRTEMSLEVISDEQNGVENAPSDDDASGEREDIVQALQAVAQVKKAIKFQEDEALQQALEKVKERPLIDASFSEKTKMLQEIRKVANFAEFHEVVDEALAQLTEIEAKAKNGKTSLNRPIEVLNDVLPVFGKACCVFTEKVELSQVVTQNLTECDMLRMQMKECLQLDRQDVEEAKKLEKKCERLLEDAAKRSKADVQRIEKKIREEEEANILKWFKDTRDEANDRMDFLTSDFETMKKNCADDIELTEGTLQIEMESKENALEKFKKKDADLESLIEDDLEKERELKEQLQQVEEHRCALETEREVRRSTQNRADSIHKKVEDELNLLLENLENLQHKVKTANVVLKQTKEVCNMLFAKAVQSKSVKNHDLENVLIQSKLMRHQALIAQAVNCQLVAETQKGTVAYLNEKLAKRKQKLQDALKRKLAKEVKDHQDKLKNISSDYEGHKKVLQKSEDKLDALLQEISALERELDQTGHNYETLANAYSRFKKQEEGDDGYSLAFSA